MKLNLENKTISFEELYQSLKASFPEYHIEHLHWKDMFGPHFTFMNENIKMTNHDRGIKISIKNNNEIKFKLLNKIFDQISQLIKYGILICILFIADDDIRLLSCIAWALFIDQIHLRKLFPKLYFDQKLEYDINKIKSIIHKLLI